jgi:protein-S-isoprenylcysteine O-methyltransferase Ste14
VAIDGEAAMTGAVEQLDRYGINTILRHLFTGVVTAVLLFLGAGTTDWTEGLIFATLNLVGWAGMSAAVASLNPGLFNERGKPTRQMQTMRQWDKIILILYTLMMFAQPFIAGLDRRSGWSAQPVSPALVIVGNAINLLGFALLAWSMIANRYFAPIVQIREGEHLVADSGPYRYVRHPGYVSVILTFIAMPLALGTWVALIPAVIGVALYVIRTALEDRTLQVELPGYAEFAQRTRYRLLPGVW